MNCKNCGAPVEDLDARFCYACGSPIVREEENKAAETIDEIKETEIIDEINATGVNEKINEPITVEAIEITEDNFKRGFFITLSVIFGVLTLALSVMEFIHFVGNENAGVYLINIGVSAIVSIIVIMYAITSNRIFSILGGISLLALAVEHFILEGFVLIRTSWNYYTQYFFAETEISGESSVELADALLGNVLIITFALLYLFLILDAIKIIVNTNKFITPLSILGYFTVVFIIILSALLTILWKQELRLGFVPVYTYMITLIISVIFAGISRSKIEK